MKALARRALERLLVHFEYRLADVKSDPPGLAGACASLKSRGFEPRTVLDVGVGPGTPWLYAAFPSARFELFEAIESFRPRIEQSIRGLDATVHYVALGEQDATASIEVDLDRPTSSTMARYDGRYLGGGVAEVRRPRTVEEQVRVRTLDSFGPFQGPTLLKLDVEGYESHVLRGARRTLADVDVIISEVSVVRRTAAELSLGNFLSMVESMGFSMVNIAEIAPMSRGGPIAYMDVVFVRNGSAMRYGPV